MAEPIAPEKLQAWREFLRAHSQLIGILEQEIVAGSGLPLTWYDVLVQIHSSPGRRLRMSELADRVVLSRSGVTRLVNRMVGAGLIVKRRCSSDRRGYFAAMTPAGEQALAASSPVHLAGIEKHFASHLSTRDALTLVQVFEKIRGTQSEESDGSSQS